MEMKLNPGLILARGRDFPVKLFYSFMRLFAKDNKMKILDIGSDIQVSNAEKKEIDAIVKRVQNWIQKHGDYTKYSSSFGTIELRTAVANFYGRRGVTINSIKDIMITRGIIDAIGKVIRSLDITHVIMPSILPFFPETISHMEGKKIIFASVDIETGEINLKSLKAKISHLKIQKGKVLMYMAHPAAPSGALMSDTYIEKKLLPFLRKNGIMLFVDNYIYETCFLEGLCPISSILSFPNASDNVIEAIGIAKEYGLPGLRIGAIAGNKSVVEAVRLLAATSVDMIPLANQRIATFILNEINPKVSAQRVIEEFYEEVLPRLEAMGWPIIKPKAGFDLLIKVPPNFYREDIKDPALYACFSILRRFGVAFYPVSFPYRKSHRFFLRIVLKQKPSKIGQALDLLVRKGFNWDSFKPNEEDIHFLNQQIKTLDLTKL
ncbi:MAG: pyridoxal phosphate-dependent aminotransferase [Patescibacteria group bacterium]